MASLNVQEVRDDLDGALARVAQGECLLVIGDDGQPIAELRSVRRGQAGRRRQRQVPLPRHPVLGAAFRDGLTGVEALRGD